MESYFVSYRWDDKGENINCDRGKNKHEAKGRNKNSTAEKVQMVRVKKEDQRRCFDFFFLSMEGPTSPYKPFISFSTDGKKKRKIK